MTLESWAFVAEIVGAIAVVASLVYVGVQIRESNRVNQANARHGLSEFVLQLSMFNAEHADRVAAIQRKIEEGRELDDGERTFQWWGHMSMVLHAETYFHHFQLGLMPEGHWKGYARYIDQYVMSPGFLGFWREVGPAFSRDFHDWLTDIVRQKHGVTLPTHDQHDEPRPKSL